MEQYTVCEIEGTTVLTTKGRGAASRTASEDLRSHRSSEPASDADSVGVPGDGHDVLGNIIHVEPWVLRRLPVFRQWFPQGTKFDGKRSELIRIL